MRFRAAAAVIGALIMLAGSGCAVRKRDLTADWPVMPAAQQFRPAAGTCHERVVQTGPADEYEPVPCASKHATETFAVITVRERDDAFAECGRRAGSFLGADWRGAWLIIQPVLPTTAAWAGGARWARCDLLETAPVDGRVVDRRGTLTGALRAGSALLMACANPTIEDDRVTEIHPVPCARPHTAEYAGLFTSPHADLDDLTAGETEKGCYAAIARFAKVPNDSDLKFRTGWISFPPDRAAWQLGDHAVRCFLWSGADRMTGSYRAAGPGKLKIHYR